MSCVKSPWMEFVDVGDHWDTEGIIYIFPVSVSNMCSWIAVELDPGNLEGFGDLLEDDLEILLEIKKMRHNKIELLIEICLYLWSICFFFPVCFCTLTFSEHMRPNEPSQFCSLFVLGRAIKYSGLVLPWEQTGGCGCIIMPQPLSCPLSTMNRGPEGVISGDFSPIKHYVPFSSPPLCHHLDPHLITWSPCTHMAISSR